MLPASRLCRWGGESSNRAETGPDDSPGVRARAEKSEIPLLTARYGAADRREKIPRVSPRLVCGPQGKWRELLRRRYAEPDDGRFRRSWRPPGRPQGPAPDGEGFAVQRRLANGQFVAGADYATLRDKAIRH